MKKIIVLLMAILMMFTVLTACGESAESKPTTDNNETPTTDNNTADNKETTDNVDSEFGVIVGDGGDNFICGLQIGVKDCNPSDLWLDVYTGTTAIYMMIEDGWKVTDESVAEIEKIYGCSFNNVELTYGEILYLDLEKDGIKVSVKVKDDWDPEYTEPIEFATVYSVWVNDFASLGMEIWMPDLHWHFGPEATFDDYVYRIKDYDVTVKDIRKNYIRFYERVKGFEEINEDWDCFMNLMFDDNGILDFINVGSLD